MFTKSGLLSILLGFIVLVLSSSVYIVNEYEKAIVLRLGKLQEEKPGPGIHLKIPLLDKVKKFDGRVLTLDEGAESFYTIQMDLTHRHSRRNAANFFSNVLQREEKIFHGGENPYDILLSGLDSVCGCNSSTMETSWSKPQTSFFIHTWSTAFFFTPGAFCHTRKATEAKSIFETCLPTARKRLHLLVTAFTGYVTFGSRDVFFYGFFSFVLRTIDFFFTNISSYSLEKRNLLKREQTL